MSKTVLELGHEIPLAGHLGVDKTRQRILRRFFWPTIFRDVAEFCECCEKCQMTTKRKIPPAPLIPLPIISEPFKKIAMDIVGPLPRSRAGNIYILVICDYATRYLEAIPLRSIDAAHIAEELIKVFARVGVPEEILTDQDITCYTSTLSGRAHITRKPTDCRAVQPNIERDAEENAHERRKRLGQTDPVPDVCVPGSPSSFHGVFPL